MTDKLLTDRQQIAEALRRSGFLLEYEIARKFEGGGWMIIPNHEVQDPSEGKSREVDLLAIRAISGQHGRLVRLIVVIECKSSGSPLVVMKHPIRSSLDYPAHFEVQVSEQIPGQTAAGRQALGFKLLQDLNLQRIRHEMDIRDYGSLACKIVREKNVAKAVSESGITLGLAAKTYAATKMYLSRHRPLGDQAFLNIVMPLWIVEGEILSCEGDPSELKEESWTRIYQNYIAEESDEAFWITLVHKDSLEDLFRNEIYRMAQVVTSRFIPEHANTENIWYI